MTDNFDDAHISIFLLAYFPTFFTIYGATPNRLKLNNLLTQLLKNK